MSQGSLVWILQVFFVEKSLFWSKIAIYEALEDLYRTFLFLNFSSLDIYDVLKCYW